MPVPVRKIYTCTAIFMQAVLVYNAFLKITALNASNSKIWYRILYVLHIYATLHDLGQNSCSCGHWWGRLFLLQVVSIFQVWFQRKSSAVAGCKAKSRWKGGNYEPYHRMDWEETCSGVSGL